MFVRVVVPQHVPLTAPLDALQCAPQLVLSLVNMVALLAEDSVMQIATVGVTVDVKIVVITPVMLNAG